MISLVVLAPHGEVAKALPVVRLAIHKLLVSVDAVFRVERLATTHAVKDMATVLPNFVLVRHWQRLDSLVPDITGVNPLSFLCFVPPHCTDTIQQQHDFPHKPALDTCLSLGKTLLLPNKG